MKKIDKCKKVIVSFFCFLICFGLCFVLLNSRATIGAANAENIGTVTKGTIHYSDGSIYEGESVDGSIRSGTGSFSWSTGETYEGTWAEDELSGTGKMIWPGLGVYEGEFQNNKRQGHGIFTWTYDKDPEIGQPISYEGDWINDKIGEKGILKIYGIGIYNGEFSRQVRSGEGAFLWTNGDTYIGHWENDAITGEGVLTLYDGTMLEGLFQKGTLEKGTVTYSVKKGIAVRNVRSGRADTSVTITYNDGTVISGKTNNQAFVGNVTIEYKNGDNYTGTIKNGVKSGKGTYTWKNGAHYTGDWFDDQMSGTGKYCYGKSETDSYLYGKFDNGKPSGTLTYVSEKKIKYKTVWSNGACTSITYSR